MEDNEEIFKEMKNAIDKSYSIHVKNLSSGNFSGNENTEVSSGVQSEKNCCVLVTPLVQLSAPTSPKSSRATPVSYFKSLTPYLRDSDDEWDYKDIEGISTNDDSSLDHIPNPINNINKKSISSNIMKCQM
jgi:hypothetical protein